jgi:hypothetical protein
MDRKPYPSDISTEEWSFVSPCLTLIYEEASQQRYPLRDMLMTPQVARFY